MTILRPNRLQRSSRPMKLRRPHPCRDGEPPGHQPERAWQARPQSQTLLVRALTSSWRCSRAPVGGHSEPQGVLQVYGQTPW